MPAFATPKARKPWHGLEDFAFGNEYIRSEGLQVCNVLGNCRSQEPWTNYSFPVLLFIFRHPGPKCNSTGGDGRFDEKAKSAEGTTDAGSALGIRHVCVVWPFLTKSKRYILSSSDDVAPSRLPSTKLADAKRATRDTRSNQTKKRVQSSGVTQGASSDDASPSHSPSAKLADTKQAMQDLGSNRMKKRAQGSGGTQGGKADGISKAGASAEVMRWVLKLSKSW